MNIQKISQQTPAFKAKGRMVAPKADLEGYAERIKAAIKPEEQVKWIPNHGEPFDFAQKIIDKGRKSILYLAVGKKHAEELRVLGDEAALAKSYTTSGILDTKQVEAGLKAIENGKISNFDPASLSITR